MGPMDPMEPVGPMRPMGFMGPMGSIGRMGPMGPMGPTGLRIGQTDGRAVRWSFGWSGPEPPERAKGRKQTIRPTLRPADHLIEGSESHLVKLGL